MSSNPTVIAEGDIIHYTVAFLHSTGEAPLGDAAFREGRVEASQEIGGKRYLSILWQDEEDPQLVLASNVCKRGSLAFTEVPAWAAARMGVGRKR